LLVLLIVLGFVTLGGWMATVGRPDVIWTCRLGAPLAMLATAWAMRRAYVAPTVLPDRLYEIAGKYFEAKGFCFQPAIGTLDDGRGQVAIFFQNRYARTVVAKVQMLPGVRSLRLSRHPLPRVEVEIECPGGAFGVVRVPFTVPPKYAGRRISYDVAAEARYGAGRGKLLHVRNGIRVGTPRELRQSYQLLLVLLMLPLGLLVSNRAARITFRLPATAPDNGLDRGPANTEILWTPDLPTGGFPVQPRKAA
jgi:hypothetical protein